MKQIFEKLIVELEEGRGAVLSTIVAEHGSTPRGVGAQMLTGRSGRLSGTIGGGSIEFTSQKIAEELLVQRRSELRRFELGGGHGLDMICGGGVSVWMQYIPPTEEWKHLAMSVLDCLEKRCAARLVLDLHDAPAVLELGGAERCERQDERFFVPLPVGERAVIFGAGHCAAALTPVLHSIGFHVTVFDERQDLLREERFPAAERLVCGKFDEISASMDLADDDYIVVMTNGHRHDLLVEEQVLRREFAYLGVMGSRRKTAAINEELLRCGIGEKELKRIHAPIGIAIKSATPEEIAISIAGEMIRVRAENRELKAPHQGKSCPA